MCLCDSQLMGMYGQHSVVVLYLMLRLLLLSCVMLCSVCYSHAHVGHSGSSDMFHSSIILCVLKSTCNALNSVFSAVNTASVSNMFMCLTDCCGVACTDLTGLQAQEQVAKLSWKSRACGTHVLFPELLAMQWSPMTSAWDPKHKMGKPNLPSTQPTSHVLLCLLLVALPT